MVAKEHPQHFKLDYALSREQTNAQVSGSYNATAIRDNATAIRDNIFCFLHFVHESSKKRKASALYFSQGGKMYIQDKVEEYADDIFDRLDKGALMYFCGLKGMMPGVLGMLENVCATKGIDFKDYIKSLKEKGQWHVEVY